MLNYVHVRDSETDTAAKGSPIFKKKEKRDIEVTKTYAPKCDITIDQAEHPLHNGQICKEKNQPTLI